MPGLQHAGRFAAGDRGRNVVTRDLAEPAGLAFAAMLLEPWWMLTLISAVYLLLMPYALFRYGRIKRRRAAQKSAAASAEH